MKLADLLRGLPGVQLTGPGDAEISGVCHDSRRVKAGDLFFALEGARADGAKHALEARRKGAAAVAGAQAKPAEFASLDVPWVALADATTGMGAIAHRFHGHPSRSLTIVGVTGTNGKTTTTYFLEAIYAAAGRRSGVIGTVDVRLGGKLLESSVNTTPISVELARILAEFRDGGATSAAMEVSSHALALRRADEIEFDAAVFTNLTRDHLDFHKTREEYLRAKARLFELLSRDNPRKPRRVAVLNSDDPASGEIASYCRGVTVLRYGLKEGEVRAENVSMALDGTTFDLAHPGGRFQARLSLVGEHNVSNALAAAAACLGLGTDPDAVKRGLENLRQVPGRLEEVAAGQDFSVFVDYAHTDSALETILAYLRRLPHRRILTVVGCGGDRDRTKRGPMGVVSCRLSDEVILTSDNPRSEDPAAILRDIEEGIRTAGLKNYKIEPDRGLAIQQAIRAAGKGDIVLIAGKGHENYQILKDKTIAFDDRETARSALRARG